MNKGQRTDMFTGAVCLFYGAMMLVGGLSINVAGKSGDYGPGFMPRLMGGMVVLLSLMLLTGTIYMARKAPAPAKNEKADGDMQDAAEDYKSILATIALLALYMVALKPVGFAVSSVIYCFLQMLVLAPQKPTKRQVALYGVISVVLPLTVNYVFINVFSLMLPAGILG